MILKGNLERIDVDLQKEPMMLRIVLVRSGCTEFDQQERIQGSLDIPLSDAGKAQAELASQELGQFAISLVYTAPDKAAVKTGERIAAVQNVKLKELDALSNLNHGLWHGKLVSEVKQQQPKVYRQWQEHPETVCPPEGETLQCAQERIRKVLQKIVKKHREGMVALVVSEPLATLVQSALSDSDVGDLWRGSLNCGQWIVLDVAPDRLQRVSAG